MLKECYGIFGFEFRLALSTRPEKAMGEQSLWDEAENALKNSLIQFAGDVFLSHALISVHSNRSIEMAVQSWRWRFLRPENRHRSHGCAEATPSMRHDPARFPDANQVRLGVRHRRQ